MLLLLIIPVLCLLLVKMFVVEKGQFYTLLTAPDTSQKTKNDALN